MNNRTCHILYGIMLAVLILIVMWLFGHYDGQSIIEESFPETIDFSNGWVLDDGTEIDPSELNELEVKPYEEFGIFHVIPEELQEGQYLCFRSKNIFYQVYYDGELVYDPYVPESRLYTQSFGTRWNYVPISMDDAGKLIEIRVKTVYDSASASVDNLYIGQPARAIMDTIEEKLVAFVTCIIMLFVGIMLIVVDIPTNMGKEKNHELLYLGLFAVSVATWCLSETHLFQYYLGDSRLLQVISCCSLMMVAIPLVLYLDAAFGLHKRWIVNGMVILSFIQFAFSMILHVTNISDVHETLWFSHIVLILSAIILCSAAIRSTFLKKAAPLNIYGVLRGVGLISLAMTAVIDIWRYYGRGSNDRAMFVRIGFLLFILCYGSSSLEKTINAVKLAARTEFVRKLAYQDGLTGIGNRTAFQEYLEDIEKKKEMFPSVGIIIFDVNDLKYVNDNLGHPVGDDMIIETAKLIEEAFSGESSCFRIGGDEFAVVMAGEQVKQQYEAGITHFKEAMEAYNGHPDNNLRISVAYGFAMYAEESSDRRLQNVYHEADAQMYENKKRMKDTQVSPEEYYRKKRMVAE